MIGLECENVSKRYRGGYVLGPLSVTFHDEITCLVGANGAGKSTLFRLLAGVEEPDAGSIERGAEGNGSLGYLPQEPTFPSWGRCRDYLAHVAWLRGVTRSARNGEVEELLASVGLAEKADAAIGKLSGGMRRRLGLAQTLVGAPRALLLDEPTVGLDPHQRVLMRGAIKAHAAGRVVVISTHMIDDVIELADRVVVLRDGMIAFSGSPETLAQSVVDGTGRGSLEGAISELISKDVAE